MAHEPMSDERMTLLEENYQRCDGDMGACYCVTDIPELIAEIRRLRAAAQQHQAEQRADHLRMNMAGISTAKPWPPVGGYYLPDPLPPVRRRGPFTEKTGRIPPTQD